MMLYKVLFCVTTSFLLDSFVSAGLTTDSSNDYYYGAVVVFNYTMNEQNFSVGSETGTDEVGSYGAHSPIQNAHGQVVHSLITKTGITDGCHFDYHRVTKTFPWIALVSRGNCSFADKIDNAIRGNASGIIVYDYKDSQENTIMSHESSQDIVSIIIHHSLASSIAAQVNDGVIVTVDINPGKRHPQPGGKPQKTTIIFVAVSFMILMLVSLAWLVFYYIQRFRIIQAHNRGQRQRQSLTRKVIAKLDTRTVRSGDEVLVNEETCAVCIECYRVGEAVRKLPCGHVYHKKCIDPWLESRQTCPMCKINVIKTLCADDATGQNSQTNESDASYTNQLEIELSDRTASTTGGDQEQLPEVEHPHSSSSEADQPTSSGQQACLKV